MDICFLGHQGWLVETPTTRVLIDPLIRDSFGASDQFGIQIYPPRDVDEAALRNVNAIFLSHEHSDHFDLPSLSTISRSATVYMGPLVVEPVAEALAALGFPVVRIRGISPINIGDLTVRLYPSHAETAFWESRVSQIYIEQVGSAAKFLIGVDALISDLLLEHVATGDLAAPNIVAVSNNSQITPPGVMGALQNRAADERRSKNKVGLVGLSVLDALIGYLKDLPDPDCVIICGGGFMKNYDNFGPFPFSDQDELGGVWNELSIGQYIVGLLPGQRLRHQDGAYGISEVDWIRPNHQRRRALGEMRERFLKEGRQIPKQALTGPFHSEAEFRQTLEAVEQELDRLAPHIMLSPLGYHALSLSQHRGLPAPDARFAFVFTNCWNGMRLVYGLNFLSGRFQNERSPVDDPLKAYPFGIEVNLRDFYAVFTAEIQIWDLAGIALHGWYDQGPEFESPVAFMYSYYGENASPHLLRKVLASRLQNLEDGR